MESFGNVLLKPGGAWLELGAGVGLLAITASAILPEYACSNYFATDLPEVIPLLERNIRRNVIMERNTGPTKIMALNMNDNSLPVEVNEGNIEVILAADLIYDDIVTTGLVDTLELFILARYNSNSKLSKSYEGNKKLLTCFCSVEKRVNFTLKDLKVTAPAYNYFIINDL